MDLHYYSERFPEALRARYGDTFKDGFRRIEERFREVRSGCRPLDVADVMAIFEPDLPFRQDWAKPDREDLEARMTAQGISERIRRLAGTIDSKKLIAEIWRGFQDLSLTSLVLHHVYPDRFAMCSHHIASLLYIAAPDVPKFYVEYCDELKVWSEREWLVPFAARHRPKLTVVDAELAIWTWYRLAYIQGSDQEKRKHRANFHKDPWVQDRRAQRISKALGSIGKLDLARSYIRTEPTVAAVIAWRELEVAVRNVLERAGEKATNTDTFPVLVDKLPYWTLSRDLTVRHLNDLWKERNPVMHPGEEISEVRAAEIVSGVTRFVEMNRHDYGPPPQSFAHSAR